MRCGVKPSGILVIAAPTPFRRAQAAVLKRNAAGVIAEMFPDATALYARNGHPDYISIVFVNKGDFGESREIEKEKRSQAPVDAILVAPQGG